MSVVEQASEPMTADMSTLANVESKPSSTPADV